jgi:hypothetical protein
MEDATHLSLPHRCVRQLLQIICLRKLLPGSFHGSTLETSRHLAHVVGLSTFTQTSLP